MKLLSRKNLAKISLIVSISSVVLFAVNLLLYVGELLSFFAIILISYSPLYCLYVYLKDESKWYTFVNRKYMIFAGINILVLGTLCFIFGLITIQPITNPTGYELFDMRTLLNFIGIISVPLVAFALMISQLIISLININKKIVKILGILSSVFLITGNVFWIIVFYDSSSIILIILFTLINLSCAFSSLLLYQKKEEAVDTAEPAK